MNMFQLKSYAVSFHEHEILSFMFCEFLEFLYILHSKVIF